MSDNYTIKKQYHPKKGIDIYAVCFSTTIPDNIFNELKALAKSYNGYYSKYQNINGFVFVSDDDAASFCNEIDCNLILEEPINGNNNDSEVMNDSQSDSYRIEFSETLRSIVKAKGVEILKNEDEVFFLLDGLNVYDAPAFKYILKAIIKEGYSSKLINLGQWNDEAQNLCDKFTTMTGFIPRYAAIVFQSIAYSLGWIDKVYVPFDDKKYSLLPIETGIPGKWNRNMSENQTNEFFLSITIYDDSGEKRVNGMIKDLGFFIKHQTHYDAGNWLAISCEICRTGKSEITPDLKAVIYDLKGKIKSILQIGYLGNRQISKHCISICTDIAPYQIGKIKLFWEIG